MLITLAMGCCQERKGKERKKERKMKSTSIGTGALEMMMIFSPECRLGCHLKGAEVREAVVTEKKEHKLETKTSKH